MPTFAIATGNYACMNGNHAAPWVADAWFKGVRNFDLPSAYEGVRKRSLDITLLPWRLGPKTPLDDFYNEHGIYRLFGQARKKPTRRSTPSKNASLFPSRWKTVSTTGYRSTRARRVEEARG